MSVPTADELWKEAVQHARGGTPGQRLAQHLHDALTREQVALSEVERLRGGEQQARTECNLWQEAVSIAWEVALIEVDEVRLGIRIALGVGRSIARIQLVVERHTSCNTRTEHDLSRDSALAFARSLGRVLRGRG